MSTSIAITGRGMVSSLGHDVRSSCAAARAGVVRPRELDYFQILSAADGEDIGVTGHPATLWTLGFEGQGRLLRLVQGALRDLQVQVPGAPWNGRSNAFYLSLPDPKRLESGPELIAVKPRTVRGPDIPRDLVHQRGVELLGRAARLSGWAGPCSVRCVKSTGHTGIAECLSDAARDLSSGAVQVAVVGGADTLLEEDTLSWLNRTARLKTPENPTGLAPGEAGAFMLLETVAAAEARGARIWGILHDLHFANDSCPIFSGKPPLGVGLAEVASHIVESSGWRQCGPVWFITDQNGESYRAMEWGHTLLRLTRRSKAFGEPCLWHPAGCFGDCGAITGAIGVFVATSAFERGYAPSFFVGIMSSADCGRRAATLLTAPKRESIQ